MSRQSSYTWEIQDFMYLERPIGHSIRSPVFWNDKDWKWEVKLYPRGDRLDSRDYLSVYVYLVSSPKSSNVSVKLRFATLDAYGGESFFVEDSKWSSFNLSGGLGLRKFISRTTLIQQRHLHRGTLKLFCKVAYHTADMLNDISLCRPENDLSNMLMNTAFSDITFQVGNKTFPAHKVILAAKSPSFCKALRMDRSGNIVITHATPDVFKEMLRFMYTGRVRHLHAYAKDLIVAAEYYKVYDLSTVCINYLVGGLTVDNAIEMVQFAQEYKCSLLEDEVLKFIETKFVKKTPKYLVWQLTNVLKNSKLY